MNSFLSLGFLVALVVLVKADAATTNAPTTNAGSTVAGSTVAGGDPRQKIKEQVGALTEACRNNNKLTTVLASHTNGAREDGLPADQAKIASNQGLPKTEPERCFLDCIYQGLNITKEGKFNEPAARQLAQVRFGATPEELTKANQMIEACTKEIVVKDTNEKCALGRLVRECFVKHGSKINFFPKP